MLLLSLLFINIVAAQATGYYFIKSNGKNENNQEWRNIEYGETCNPSIAGSPCVSADENGVFQLNSTLFCGASNWPYNTIMAQTGHKIEVTFDLFESSNINLQCTGDQSKKVSYELNFPAIGKAFTLASQQCDGKLNDVIINFKKKNAGGSTENIWMQSGTWDDKSQGEYKNKIQYKYNYEVLNGEAFDFTEYMTINMQKSKAYEIDMNLPNEGYKNQVTNVKVDDASYPIPKQYGNENTTYSLEYIVSNKNVVVTQKGKLPGYKKIDNSATSRDWKYSTDCGNESNNECILRDETTGKYKFNGNHFIGHQNWYDNAISARPGDHIDITFDLKASANFWLKGASVGGSKKKVTYTFNVPVINTPYGIKFQECDGFLNDVVVNFKEGASTNNIWMKNGAFNTPIVYKFNYEVGENKTIDFQNYMTINMQESNKYTVDMNLPKEDYDKVTTNVKVNDASYPVPNNIEDRNNYHTYVFERGNDRIVNITRKEGLSGYKKIDNSVTSRDWKYIDYECKSNDGCVLSDSNTGIYKFNGNHFIGHATNWLNNAIEARSGDHIDITFDITGSADFWLKRRNDNNQNKVTYTLNIPPVDFSYGYTFQECDGLLNDVIVNFKEKEGGSTGTLCAKSGAFTKQKISYKFNYENKNVNFTNYMPIKMEVNNNYEIDMNIPFDDYNKNKTNIKLNDASYPVPKEKTISETKKLIFENVDNQVIVTGREGRNAYKVTIVNDVQTWECVQGLNPEENKECVFADEDGYFKFNETQFGSQISKIIIVGEKDHSILVDLNNTIDMTVNMTAKGKMEKVKLNVPANEKDITVNFVDCDGKVGKLLVNFEKITTKEIDVSVMSLNVGGNANNKMPIQISYETTSDDTAVDFAEYRGILMVESEYYEMTFDEIIGKEYNKTSMNIYLEDSDFPKPTLQNKKDIQNKKEYEYVFSITGERNRVQLTVNEKDINFAAGYFYDATSRTYKYSAQVEMPNPTLVSINPNGIYKIDLSKIDNKGKEWQKQYIEVEGGHKVEVHFNHGFPDNFILRKGDVTKSVNKVTYSLYLYGNAAQYGVMFDGCDGQLEDVHVKYMKMKDTTLRKIYMKSGCKWNGDNCNAGTTFTNKINYIIDYEMEANVTTIDFKNYPVAIFQINTGFTIKFEEWPATVLYGYTTTNLGFQDDAWNSKPNDYYINITDSNKTIYVNFREAPGAETWFKGLAMERTFEEPYAGPFYKGYVYETKGTYKFSDSINPRKYEGYIISKGNDNTFEFPGSVLAVSKEWASNTFYAQKGHKIIINLNSGSNSDIKLHVEGQGNGKASFEFIMHSTERQYSIVFNNGDGDIGDVNLNLKKGDARETVYIKTAGENNYFHKQNVNYKISYELNNGESKIDFKQYSKVVFEKNGNYTLQWMNFPKGALYEIVQPTNIYAQDNFPIISSWTEGSGNNEIKYITDISTTSDFSHVKVMTILTELKNAVYSKGYMKLEQGSYKYSEKITAVQIQYGSLSNVEQKYTFNGKMMALGDWAKSQIVVGGDTEVTIELDRDLNLDGTPEHSVKLYVATDKEFNTSETDVKILFEPTSIKNDLYFDQREAPLEKPVKLYFVREDDIQPKEPVYVKGNVENNKDGYEAVKYQLQYKIDDIDDFFFEDYKEIYLQEIYAKKDPQTGEIIEHGIQIVDIFFGGYYPQFSESDMTYTNVYANNAAQCHGQLCPPLPEKFTTPRYPFSDKEDIVYTLKLEEGEKGKLRRYYIVSERMPTNKKPPTTGGATSKFICAIIILLAILL